MTIIIASVEILLNFGLLYLIYFAAAIKYHLETRFIVADYNNVFAITRREYRAIITKLIMENSTVSCILQFLFVFFFQLHFLHAYLQIYNSIFPYYFHHCMIVIGIFNAESVRERD